MWYFFWCTPRYVVASTLLTVAVITTAPNISFKIQKQSKSVAHSCCRGYNFHHLLLVTLVTLVIQKEKSIDPTSREEIHNNYVTKGFYWSSFLRVSKSIPWYCFNTFPKCTNDSISIS